MDQNVDAHGDGQHPAVAQQGPGLIHSPDAAVQPAMGGNNISNTLPFKLDLPSPFHGDGSESFSHWIQRFEVALNIAPSFQDRSKLLAAKLAGPAFSYWQSLPDNVKSDYDATKVSLSSVFGRTQYLATFQTYLNARPRKHNEPLEVFAAELSCLVKESFPTYGYEAQQCELFRRFVAGLDPSLQLKVHEHGATTIEAAQRIAAQCERAQLAMTVTTPAPLLSGVTSLPVGHVHSPLPGMAEMTAAIMEIKSELSDIKRHQSKHSGMVVDNLTERVAQLQHDVSTITGWSKHSTDRNRHDDGRGRSPQRFEARHRWSRDYSPRRPPPHDHWRRDNQGHPFRASGGHCHCCPSFHSDELRKGASPQRSFRSDSPGRNGDDGLGCRDDPSPRRVRFVTSQHQNPDYDAKRQGNDW